ncbi:MAG TPA: ATP-binding protein [Opitutaceae bacterium]|nr:ATP-binding protein [Opitutaceae bacterium]
MFEAIFAFLALGSSVLAWWFREQWLAADARHERELVDQRVQREHELRSQASRTAALFDRMVEGIIVVGAQGRIRLANLAAGNLFGFAPPATDSTLLEATRHHEVAALLARLEGEPEVLNHELRLDRLTGTRFLHVNALALRTADGARDGAILVFHDLTRIRQLEAVRQDFVANVSHELRTPLSLIKSAAETLIDGGRSDARVTGRFLDIIDKNASRLTFLIDDLLLLARLDSGRIELDPRPVSVHELVQDALADAALLARGKGVELTNKVPRALQALADPQRLRQVLANLIDNAIKYGRADGHVLVSARALSDRAVEIGVRDDGPGIPPDAKERIFERFFRVDKARSREQGGTGLGLAIVKNVVQAHGGEVRVESTFGAGAEFFFTLPAVTAMPAGLEPAA